MRYGQVTAYKYLNFFVGGLHGGHYLQTAFFYFIFSTLDKGVLIVLQLFLEI